MPKVTIVNEPPLSWQSALTRWGIDFYKWFGRPLEKCCTMLSRYLSRALVFCAKPCVRIGLSTTSYRCSCRANVIRSHQNTLLTNSCPDVTMLYLVGMTDCKDTWRPWMGGNDHETVQHWSMTCLRWTRGPNPCYVNVPQSYHNTTQSLVDNYGTSLNGIFATFKPYHQPESIVIVIMPHVASPAGSYQRHYERSRVSWC